MSYVFEGPYLAGRPAYLGGHAGPLHVARETHPGWWVVYGECPLRFYQSPPSIIDGFGE